MVDTSVLIDFYRKTDKSNSASADIAVNINMNLKRKRKLIDIADLFIAATAIAYDLPLATLNRKHFERIEHLNII